MNVVIKKLMLGLGGLVLLAASLWVMTAGLSHVGDARMNERLPISPVGALFDGYYLTQGEVQPQNEAIVARYSGQRVVFTEYRLTEKYRDSEGDLKTRVLEQGQSGVPFQISDGTGSVSVIPKTVDGQTIELTQTYRRSEGALTYIESSIVFGQSVSVKGFVTDGVINIAPENEILPSRISDVLFAGQTQPLQLKAAVYLSIGVGLLTVGIACVLMAFAQYHYWLLTFSITLATLAVFTSHGVAQLQKDWAALSNIYQTRVQAVSSQSSVLAQQDLYSFYWLVKTSSTTWPDTHFLKRAKADWLIPPFLPTVEKQVIEQSVNHSTHSQDLKRDTSMFLPLFFAGLLIFSGVLVVMTSKVLRLKRNIDLLMTSDIGGVTYGVCEITGQAQVVSGHELLSTEQGGEPCLAYQVTEQVRQRTGKKRRWVTVRQESTMSDFELHDATGHIRVSPTQASIDYAQSNTYRVGQKRVTESWIPQGVSLYCLGFAGLVDADDSQLSLMHQEGSHYLISTKSESTLLNNQSFKAFLLTSLAMGISLMGLLGLLSLQGLISPMTLFGCVLMPSLFSLILTVILHYNGLVFLRNRIDKVAADIESLLQRRSDLWPALNEVVSGYLAHESDLLAQLSQWRASTRSEKNSLAQIDIQTQTINAVMARLEAYPELKAQPLMADLHTRLTNSEDQLALVREGYNDAIERYNTQISQLPDVIMASAFGFKSQPYWVAA